jgi:endonuclease YncB( thermonuclease family)
MTSGPVAHDQPTVGALNQIAEAADETARDQQRVSRRARSMSRQRLLGWSWSKILERERQPGLLVLMDRSARRLHEVTGRFRTTLAQALVGEGFSTRQIAKIFGVTHQRISAMLGRSAPRRPPPRPRP